MVELGLLAGVLSVLLTIVIGALQGYFRSLVLVAAVVVGTYLVWKWIPTLVRWVWPRGGAFREISDAEFVSIARIDQALRVRILAHTGKSIYGAVHAELERALYGSDGASTEIKVLTRVPTAEGVGRYELIRGTVNLVKNLCGKGVNAEIRFYDALPSIRGVIVEHENGTRISFVSTYVWERDWQVKESPPQQGQKRSTLSTSHALDRAIIVKDTEKHPAPIVRMLESWFDHYWGHDEIHTVAFDFDDTLISSANLQINALADALCEPIDDRLLPKQAWSEEALPFRDNRERLRQLIATKFASTKEIDAVLTEMLPGADAATLDGLVQRRKERRYASLEQAAPFPGMPHALERLKNRYSFAIITLADETKIRTFMDQLHLLKYFPVILGDKDPVPSKPEGVRHRKVYLLQKLGQLLGVPLDRIVYVGDSDDDRDSALLLHLDFIRARVSEARDLEGASSLPEPIVPPYVMRSYNELDKLLEGISKRKRDKKLEPH